MFDSLHFPSFLKNRMLDKREFEAKLLKIVNSRVIGGSSFYCRSKFLIVDQGKSS